nr:uncharacterized protein LOC109163356 [Ipomoea batatas]
MDDLSAKESRQLLTLARNVIAEPWPLPESKASSEEFDEKALQASLQILKNSSQPMVTSTPLLLEVCVSESLPVSVPYVPSLFVSESVPDLSISQFSEFHIRDVAQYVDQQGEPVSGSALSIPVLVVVPSVSVCGISFAAVVMHRQMDSSIEASLTLLRTSIAAQQDAGTALECTLLDHYREITRLETRHATILATQAHTSVHTKESPWLVRFFFQAVQAAYEEFVRGVPGNEDDMIQNVVQDNPKESCW